MSAVEGAQPLSSPSSPSSRLPSNQVSAASLPGARARRDDGRSGEALAARYARTRDPQLREAAVLEYRGLVEILALKMIRKGVLLEDLVQVGTIGLIMALDRFDPDRGVKFSTYAVNTIVGEIKHYFRDCTWLVKVPRRLQEIATSVHRANEELRRELGQAPTLAELARRLDLSEELIVEAMELDTIHNPSSLEARLGHPDAETQERLADVLGDPDARLQEVVDHQPLRLALDRLEPRKQWILRRRYFDEWSQTDVGRALGISQMHVSRLEREALGELRWVLDY